MRFVFGILLGMMMTAGARAQGFLILQIRKLTA